MRRTAHVVRLAVLSLSLAAACDDAGKGDEEAPFSEDGDEAKDDSYGRPTEHGALSFAEPNPAELGPTSRFHAWNFALSGAATVRLETTGSLDRDTVMYLYRRAPGDTRWGAYLAKDDDGGRGDLSRIDVVATEPGEYRVKIKGHALSEAGPFALKAKCTGAGCAAPDAPTLVVPLVADDGTELLSSYNDRLEAAGLPPLPDAVAVAERADWDRVMGLIAEAAVVIEDLPEAEQYLSGPGSLPGTCFRGDGAAIADLTEGLVDGVFSDMYGVLAWRFGAATYVGDDYASEAELAAEVPRWDAYDAASDEVLIVHTQGDDGEAIAASVPRCP